MRSRRPTNLGEADRRITELEESVKRLEDRSYLDRRVLDEREKKIGQMALEISRLTFEAHNPEAKHFPLCNWNLYNQGDCNLECSWNMERVRKAWGQANSGQPVTEGIPNPRTFSVWFKTTVPHHVGIEEIADELKELFEMEDLKILPTESITPHSLRGDK